MARSDAKRRPARTAEPSAAAAPAGVSRRDEIIKISEDLFAQRGFVGTTVRDIAEQAQILSGSLYHHFRSKESIAEDIMRRYWDDLFTDSREVLESDRDPATRVRQLIEVSIVIIGRRLHAARLMLNDWNYLIEFLPWMEDNMDSLQAIWTRVLEDGKADGTFRSDLDPAVVYRTIMSSVSSVGRWFSHSGPVPLDEVVRTMQEVFLGGLLSRDPGPAPA